MIYSKTLCKTASLKKTNYPLKQVKSIAECSMGSILLYFWPSLSLIIKNFTVYSRYLEFQGTEQNMSSMSSYQ